MSGFLKKIAEGEPLLDGDVVTFILHPTSIGKPAVEGSHYRPVECIKFPTITHEGEEYVRLGPGVGGADGDLRITAPYVVGVPGYVEDCMYYRKVVGVPEPASAGAVYLRSEGYGRTAAWVEWAKIELERLRALLGEG